MKYLQILLMLIMLTLINACSVMNNEEIRATVAEGDQYALGQGVIQNDETAFKLFKKAADNGDAFAQNELAFYYYAGKGTPKNDEKAFYWYKKAALHGLASAEFNVSRFYELGIGTDINLAFARDWLEKSADHGFEPAKNRLAQFNNGTT